MDTEVNEVQNLKPYLSPIAVWGLAFGCAVGWGAFAMPGNTFLPIAGPIGTAVGMVIGGIIMLIIGCNYFYMMNRFPTAGGTCSYAKNILGNDHGFLSAWFIILVYLAITWANATALTLIFRNLLGDFFKIGLHYQIAGFDIYLGEAAVSFFAICLTGLVAIRGGKIAAAFQTIMAGILFIGIVFVFGTAAINFDGNIFDIQPAFAPNIDPSTAILGIVVLAPWAFAGFESISNSAEEFKFSPAKTFPIIVSAITAAVAAYAFLTILAVTDLPGGYTNWADYLKNLDKFSGYDGMPTLHNFYALFPSNVGVWIFAIAVICAVGTGLLGNMLAASRLLYSVSRDGLLPKKFSVLNKYGNPQNAIIFIMLVSLPVPFLGRTAISWIIDVNTIGAVIAYAYTSVTAFICAKNNRNFKFEITGALGTIISAIFFIYFMVPNIRTITTMTTESYLILIVWSILGFIFFRQILSKDEERNFGNSTVVWIVILFMILFTSMMWVQEATHDISKSVLKNLEVHHTEEFIKHGVITNEFERYDSEVFLSSQMDSVGKELSALNFMQMGLVLISLLIMFSIYDIIMKREKDMEMQKIEAEQNSKAKTTFLSNMSHDIRTPMNAIVGYTALLKKDKSLSPQAKDFLNKIETSSDHLLALINDVLDMSRIESGKMDLDESDNDLFKIFKGIYDIFATQMKSRKIEFKVDTSGIKNRMVICDKNRLNRVLMNLTSNAYKFTPEKGSVTITVKQLESDYEKVGNYEIRVKDSGIGMSPEFAATVFEAFTREKSETVKGIQGTGLGMAITKSMVDLMGGEIRVETEKGKGTEFIINISFEISDELPEEEKVEETSSGLNFAGKRLLLVDDIEVNREIATMMLTASGFLIETAADGQEAVKKVAESAPKYFAAVLMDIQMPTMNGYEATQAIRKLDNPALAKIPIVAMTANAFSEDIQAAKDAGMDGHISKPIDVPKMMETLSKILK